MYRRRARRLFSAASRQGAQTATVRKTAGETLRLRSGRAPALRTPISPGAWVCRQKNRAARASISHPFRLSRERARNFLASLTMHYTARVNTAFLVGWCVSLCSARKLVVGRRFPKRNPRRTPSVNTAAFFGIHLGWRPISGKPTIRPLGPGGFPGRDQSLVCVKGCYRHLVGNRVLESPGTGCPKSLFDNGEAHSTITAVVTRVARLAVRVLVAVVLVAA